MDRYFWGYDTEAKHFWHWYAVLTEKLTGRLRVHNVPESIDSDFLIRRLLLDGRIAFFKDGSELVAYNYSDVDPLDKYGRTTSINVNYRYGNDIQKHNYNADECVFVYCKPSVKLHRGIGFVSEVCRTASILADIDTTMKIVLENDRLVALADTVSDSDIDGVNQLFDKMRRGDRVIAVKSSIIDNVKVNPLVNKSSRDLMDYTQLTTYYLAEFYNNIGISALATSKRERMVTDEVTANKEVVDFSFKQAVDLINEGLAEVNAKFGTDINVEFIDPVDDDMMEGEDTNADNNDEQKPGKDSADTEDVGVSEESEGADRDSGEADEDDGDLSGEAEPEDKIDEILEIVEEIKEEITDEETSDD